MEPEDGKRFIRAARTIRRRLERDGTLPRKVTIHRYYPRRRLGGVMGLLNFERGTIDAMIEQGYEETCSHDCGANGCVIPEIRRKSRSAAAGKSGTETG
jgi:hypothetical protein